MRYLSPLRYPGGKASLTGYLGSLIDLNDLRGCSYYEPYAGGAGAALGLLRSEVVSEIFVNDADERIGAFWSAVLDHGNRFVDQIFTIPLTITEWRKQREICSHPEQHDRFDVGFAAFYMNRCNRSGVLTGSGPIGGYEQNGKWRLDVRFSRSGLAERVIALSRLRECIHLSQLDALIFLKKKIPRGGRRSRVFVYLDPPYVNKGQRLYLNSYTERDHASLARHMASQKIMPWLMSYDDTTLVRHLYKNQKIASLPIRYSLQTKRSAEELIIAPHRLTLPNSGTVQGACFSYHLNSRTQTT